MVEALKQEGGLERGELEAACMRGPQSHLNRERRERIGASGSLVMAARISHGEKEGEKKERSGCLKVQSSPNWVLVIMTTQLED